MKLALFFTAILTVSADPELICSEFHGFTDPPPPTPSPDSVIHVARGNQDANALIYVNEVKPDGSYKYYILTDNGIAALAKGAPRDFGGNPRVAPVVSKGFFFWRSPGGQEIAFTYVADENGYRPSSGIIGDLSALKQIRLFKGPASDFSLSIVDPLEKKLRTNRDM